tara:strand:- start:1456 stop:2472 length:1017 start_codon:yes stop_codon:yes gene_type:complete
MNLFPEITFKDPEYFWMLMIPLFHLLWKTLIKKNEESTMLYSVESFFPNSKNIKIKTRNLPYLMLILSSFLIIISLARPQKISEWQEEKTQGIDIIIALDISASMLAKDLKPNRLEASKDIAIEFIKKRKNDRIGLVVFSGKSFTQCPLTTDYNSLINLFNDVKFGIIDDGRTAIGDGLGNSINRLIESDSKSKVIILLTDGENTAGKITPETASEIASSDSINIKIYSIGIGTKGMAKTPVAYDEDRNRYIYDYAEVRIDEETLTNISNKTGGKYFRATDNKSLQEIYAKIDELETSEIETYKYQLSQEKFTIPSIIALVLIFISFLLQKTIYRKIH